MFFRPDQYPGAVFPRELSDDFVGSIVTRDSIFKIVSVTNVEPTNGILKHVHPEHGQWLQR
jgi:hypothetical protein